MVPPPAHPDRIFFQLAQAGRGLAGIVDARFGTLRPGHVASRQRGDAAQSLDEIEGGALRLENTYDAAADSGGDVPRPDGCPIPDENLVFEERGDMMKDAAGYLDTGQDTPRLDQQ